MHRTMSHVLVHAGATQVSFGQASFTHEGTAAGLSLTCSLKSEEALDAPKRGVQAACLCTALVERLGAGETPVSEQQLQKVWGMLLEVFTGEAVDERVETLFQEEYVAARGAPMLLLEGSPAQSPDKGGGNRSEKGAAQPPEKGAASGSPTTQVHGTPLHTPKEMVLYSYFYPA